MLRYKKKWVKERRKRIAEFEDEHGRIQTFEFNTIAIIGPTGCGKTICLTWIGKNFGERGFDVFSNFKTTIPGATYVDDPFELLQAEGIVLVDEIQKYVNSRLSSDARTLFYSELTSEARKTTSSLYCTSQRFMNIDIKVRNNVNYVLFPEYNKELHWCTVFAFEGVDYEKPLDIFEFDCIPIYPMFDTKERVKGIYTPEEKDRLKTLIVKHFTQEELREIVGE